MTDQRRELTTPRRLGGGLRKCRRPVARVFVVHMGTISRSVGWVSRQGVVGLGRARRGLVRHPRVRLGELRHGLVGRGKEMGPEVQTSGPIRAVPEHELHSQIVQRLHVPDVRKSRSAQCLAAEAWKAGALAIELHPH